MFYFIIVIGILAIICNIVFKRTISVNTGQNSNKIYNNNYSKKKLMTNEEQYFYNLLKHFSNEYEIMPQVNLATIVEKVNNKKYQTELYRNIDFGIFTKDYHELLLLIEINDQTHNTYKRKERDKKVKAICQIADIRLMTFYTNYSNKPEYVLNRIKTELENIQQSRMDISINEQILQQNNNSSSNNEEDNNII